MKVQDVLQLVQCSRFVAILDGVISFCLKLVSAFYVKLSLCKMQLFGAYSAFHMIRYLDLQSICHSQHHSLRHFTGIA